MHTFNPALRRQEAEVLCEFEASPILLQDSKDYTEKSYFKTKQKQKNS